MALSSSTQAILLRYLLSLNSNQQLQQTARQAFSSNTYYQISTCFQRFDKFKKGYLIPSDFTQFMLENGIVSNEEEIYLVFRDFDRKRVGRVDLEDFKTEILPRENTRLKKEVLGRKEYDVVARLDIELEFQLGKYFKSKLEGIKARTKISDQLIRQADYSTLKVFELISQGKNTIDRIDQIDSVIRKNGASLKNQDLRRILSSLTFNRQQILDISTFQSHIDPFKIGFYPGYKVQLANKINQKNKYSEILNARSLLNKERELNGLEISRLYDDYNILRDDNLRRSRRIVDQSREQIECQEDRMNNLRMSREIERETVEIRELSRLREIFLEQQIMMRSRRIYL